MHFLCTYCVHELMQFNISCVSVRISHAFPFRTNASQFAEYVLCHWHIMVTTTFIQYIFSIPISVNICIWIVRPEAETSKSIETTKKYMLIARAHIFVRSPARLHAQDKHVRLNALCIRVGCLRSAKEDNSH